MKKRNIFSRQRLSLAVMLALATSAGLQLAHAGAGWGESTDINGNTIKTPTYYANSPSGLFPDADCFITQPPSSGPFDTSAPFSIDSTSSYKQLEIGTPSTDGLCDSGKQLRKFVDPLASIPVAVADTATYPDSNYYEIAVVDFTQRMHSDLAKETRIRGYVQISPNGTVPLYYLNADGSNGAQILLPNGQAAMAVAKPSYLGPIITATTGRPTRVKFYNLLPAGSAGNLHLPVDETMTGAGLGPDGKTKYQQNRAEIHLHGGDNPWISDGTPHQWILPAADEIALKAAHPEMARGVGAKNVPDMPDPGPGAMTYYFPNGQSGRLMFYHDHTLGITRLNVYAGLAAGYQINDAPNVGENYGKDANGAITSGTLSDILDGIPQIPLIIQDKTFVPKNIAMQDAKWDAAMGQEGDLWYPHVYETNQDPNSVDGTNPVGRWDWGNWFWPVFPSVYDLPTGQISTINATTGLSEVSTTPEAFMDTPVVNGTAYPSLTVEPKAYRFRVLNAANDRMVNLGLYLAADKNTTKSDAPTDSAGTVVCDGRTERPDHTPLLTTDCTEVKMVNFDASYKAPSSPYSPDGYSNGFPSSGGITGTGWGAQVAGLFPQGAPDPATAGPHIVQIGNEGGLLVNPLDIPSTPLNYEYNKRSVTVLNVQERGLFLGNAERADVLIDFSQYAGKTLILYNDAPAPVPASDPRIDYYTGNGDNTTEGGAPSTIPGYGPNTRTVMQIVVAPTATGTIKTVDVNALKTALPTAYASNQAAPIVPEPEYNAAFPSKAGFPATARNNARIYTGSVYLGKYQPMSFTTPEDINYFPAPVCTSATDCATKVAAQQTKPVAPTGSTVVPNGQGLIKTPAGQPVSVYVQSKAIQELFDPTYGRMNATLGVELPFTSSLTQTTIPLGYVDPTTEKVADGETQFWKITHNGVDSHPVHFHLVNLQVINRIGWDGTLKPPYGDETGWKETIKMHPLEDVIVAVRAKKPTLGQVDANNALIPNKAFGLPLSSRLMDPSQPAGSLLGFTQVDPMTGNPLVVQNSVQNFGWEYVWHCHILGHEENDFMRPLVFNANELAATAPTALTVNNGVLTWKDNATTEYAYKVERGITTTVKGKSVTTYTDLTALVTPAQQAIGVAPLANATTFTDTTTLASGTPYIYRVTAIGANGNGSISYTYTVPAPPPNAPNNLTATTSATSIALSWRDQSNNETSFNVWRSTNGGAFAQVGTVARTGTATTQTGGTVSYTDTGIVAGTYQYYVTASGTTATSAQSNTVTINFVPPPPVAPSAPSNIGVSFTRANTTDTATVTWRDNSNNETGFIIEIATDSGFTNVIFTGTAGANTTSLSQAGLARRTNYYFRVKAANGTLVSAWNTLGGNNRPTASVSP